MSFINPKLKIIILNQAQTPRPKRLIKNDLISFCPGPSLRAHLTMFHFDLNSLRFCLNPEGTDSSQSKNFVQTFFIHLCVSQYNTLSIDLSIIYLSVCLSVIRV